MTTFHYKNPNAPKADAIHVGAVVSIRYDDRVLFDHRQDGKWGLIGGEMEVGESLENCVRREALEETGLTLGPLRLVGSFSDPTRIIEYSKRTVQSITICFDADSDSNKLRLSDESSDARFFTAKELVTLDIVATHSMIVPYLYVPEKWPIIE